MAPEAVGYARFAGDEALAGSLGKGRAMLASSSRLSCKSMGA